MTPDGASGIRWRPLLLCGAATGAVYAKTISYPFVSWIDPVRVVLNEAVTDPTLADVFGWFADLRAHPYQPFVTLVDSLNALPGGADSAIFHAVSVALHVLVTVLLYRWLRLWRFDHMPSVLGALFFALHPLRVEAVAWVSGRDALVAGLCVLLSSILYASWRRSNERWRYGGALLAAIAGAASSVAASTLPLFLLFYDLRIQKRDAGHAVRTTLPFMVVGAAATLVAVFSRLMSPDLLAVASSDPASLIAGPAGAVIYFGWKTLVPNDLSILSSVPSFGGWWWALALLSVAGIAGVWRWSRPYPEREAGLIWSLTFLLPVMAMSVSDGLLSDRLMYLPAMGLSLIAASVIHAGLVLHDGRYARPVKIVVLVVLAFLGTMSSIQGEIWKSSTALWTRTAELRTGSPVAHNYLGSAIAQEGGDLRRAEREFSIALGLDPNLQSAYVNRALVRGAMGRTDEAIDDLNDALRLDATDAATRMRRASMHRRAGRTEEALRDINLALALQPMNLGWQVIRVEVLVELGRTGEAATEVEVLRRSGIDISLHRQP